MRNSTRILLLSLICTLPVLGQSKGGGTSTGTGTGTGTATPSPSVPPQQPMPQPQTTQPQMPTYSRPMYVSGKVMMDDGSQPPASITIIRICNGITRAMGYTSAHGDFSFDMNHAEASFQDASMAGGASLSDPTSTRASLDNPMTSMRGTGGTSGGFGSSSDLLGCELRAQLAGYRSTAIQLAQRRSMDDPDVGVILLHHMSQDEGTTISMTSMMAPKDAKKAYHKALEDLKKKKNDDALKELQKAVTVYPKYADAWFRLGTLQMDAKETATARDSFKKAMEADPKLVTPYVNMAILDAREGKWKEVAESTGRAIKLDPVDFPVAFYFDALANYNLQNFEAAERSARQLQKLDTQHRFPIADRILASVLADRKDYPGAAAQMRNYLKFAGSNKDADEVRGQLQQLEKIINEQGETKP